jgi:hypothetical protein
MYGCVGYFARRRYDTNPIFFLGGLYNTAMKMQAAWHCQLLILSATRTIITAHCVPNRYGAAMAVIAGLPWGQFRRVNANLPSA